jgi:hypothetical protein
VRSNFYDLIFAGIRGDGDIGQNYKSIGSDGPASILERHGVNDVPGLPRRVGVGGWLSFDGFRKHIRVFCHIKVGHGNGAHMWTGLWSKTMGYSGSNTPKNSPHPSLRRSSYWNFVM